MILRETRSLVASLMSLISSDTSQRFDREDGENMGEGGGIMEEGRGSMEEGRGITEEEGGPKALLATQGLPQTPLPRGETWAARHLVARVYIISVV